MHQVLLCSQSQSVQLQADLAFHNVMLGHASGL